MNTVSDHREIPAEVLGDGNRFLALMRFWYAIHYASGITGVAAGAAAGLLAQNLIFGLVASVLTGVVTFLGPLQKADSYKHAHYCIKTAVARFRAIRDTPVEWLLEEHTRAVQIVLTGDLDTRRVTP